MTVAAPLAGILLSHRLKRGKEDPRRLAERRGESTVPRPRGPLVWVHGASVGEVAAIIPLVERIASKNFKVLVTSGTVGSAKLCEQRLPAGVIHQFVPWDTPRFIARFLDHWKPDLALFTESDLWPNIIVMSHARRIPLILVNGRLSERSFNRWRYAPATIGAMLSRFDLCLAQSPAYATRYRDLGTPRIATTGNLKLDVPEPPADRDSLQALQSAIGARTTIAAASTHAGAEQVTDGGRLTVRVGAWLTDAAERVKVAASARETVTQLAGALDRTLAALDPYFMQIRMVRQDGHA